MPIHLYRLPTHIRDSVIQKFDLKEFVNFHQCSKKAFDSARAVKTRFSLRKIFIVSFNFSNKVIGTKIKGKYRTDFLDFPLRIDGGNGLIGENDIETVFSEEYCIALIKFFLLTGSTLKILTIRNFLKLACSPESLCKLVEITKVEKMTVTHLLPSDFMGFKAIKKVAEFVTDEFVTDREVLAIETLRFHLFSSNITSAGINKLLKELIAETRIIEDGYIKTDNKLQSDDILHGIPILNSTIRCGSKHVEFGRSRTIYNILFNEHNVHIFKGLIDTD